MNKEETVQIVMPIGMAKHFLDYQVRMLWNELEEAAAQAKICSDPRPAFRTASAIMDNISDLMVNLDELEGNIPPAGDCE